MHMWIWHKFEPSLVRLGDNLNFPKKTLLSDKIINLDIVNF